MENYIRRMSGKQYLERMSKEPIILIPTGACEIYGPQLPMGTDLIVAKRIAELVAEKVDAVIAPTIEVGESSALMSFDCTFAMPRKILEDYLDFLVGKLIQDGGKNFLFVTGHAGNVDTVNYIAKKYMHQFEIKYAQIDWWRFATVHNEGICDYKGYMCNGHASECGTSVMLYLFPDLVNMNELTCIDPKPNSKYADIIQIDQFIKKTPNGTVGDATVGSAEKGEKIVHRCIERIVEFIGEYY